MTDPRDREAAERLLRRWQDGAGDGWDTLIGCVASALAEARREGRRQGLDEAVAALRARMQECLRGGAVCDVRCETLAILAAQLGRAASPEGPSEEPTNG